MSGAELTRRLGPWDAVAIVAGTIIGSGIFIVPGAIAREAPNAGLILAVWVAGGLLTLCGALAFAELGAMFPHSGGQYVYLREAYSPLWGFLFSWILLLVIRSGGAATLAVGFSIYLGYFFPLSTLASKAVSAGVILLLTALNYRTVVGGVVLQGVTTALKATGLLLISSAGLAVGSGVGLTEAGRMVLPSGSALSVAMIACLWSYNGWFHAGFVGGEIKDPHRNLPRGLLAGVGLVMALYLVANVSYLSVLSVEEIAATDRVAAVVAERAFGSAGGAIVSVTILVSIFGALNAGILAAPRVYYAQARDGLFFKTFAEVHPKFGTPASAVLLQGVWAAILSASGSYLQLLSFAMFAAWIFYAMAVFGVIVLRRRRPQAERPYRMWGYPVTPALFVLASIWLVANTLAANFGPSLAVLATIAAGAPAYLWMRNRSS